MKPRRESDARSRWIRNKFERKTGLAQLIIVTSCETWRRPLMPLTKGLAFDELIGQKSRV